MELLNAPNKKGILNKNVFISISLIVIFKTENSTLYHTANIILNEGKLNCHAHNLNNLKSGGRSTIQLDILLNISLDYYSFDQAVLDLFYNIYMLYQLHKFSFACF